ncbi:DegT/DnrJ/EryC1/StrS family aminotransferase [Corticimicrobacter populi]|uniref:Aminotransferase n=1 Tax=Corticimicrobacter populi TaxID=2175229 RepID=A0A2V1JTV2_9BURK|nr:DegT/DnrJ/EryC1/StrS family aminotransferase [Corticimicrobacter populi]PWF21221.1 aminotransferase [Corticimicrobacter populi]
MNTRTSPPVFVTQPSLPPLEEFLPYLQAIWDSKTLTNGGPMHQQLEKALCEYLGVDHIALFCNGTIALLTALQALDIQGEVITTPYSFVATSHSLLWNRLTPVFVDVDPATFNLDPARIEAAITEHTTAILPVHCYGIPCDTTAIQAIAQRHGLKVIYDAAHAFGVEDTGGSILRHGDLSVLSFHATKVFNTFEGGAIVCHDATTKQRIDRLKNFGFIDETTVAAAGINGKMSEVNAAFGLLQLKHVDQAIEARRQCFELYRSGLADIPGIRPGIDGGIAKANHAYFPILVEPPYPLSRDELHARLRAHGIHARRYFYPLISDFPMYRDAATGQWPHAAHLSKHVLCLPIFPTLSNSVIDTIIALINGSTNATDSGKRRAGDGGAVD